MQTCPLYITGISIFEGVRMAESDGTEIVNSSPSLKLLYDLSPITTNLLKFDTCGTKL